MDRLFHLIGLALPDTPTILRLKVLVAGGVGGVAAGLLFALSGVEGSITRGALMAICGLTVIGITFRSFLNEHRKNEADRAKARQLALEVARREAERLAREASCVHHWEFDDDGLDVGDVRYVCRHCGAYRRR
jgi:hypothetical protein